MFHSVDGQWNSLWMVAQGVFHAHNLSAWTSDHKTRNAGYQPPQHHSISCWGWIKLLKTQCRFVKRPNSSIEEKVQSYNYLFKDPRNHRATQSAEIAVLPVLVRIIQNHNADCMSVLSPNEIHPAKHQIQVQNHLYCIAPHPTVQAMLMMWADSLICRHRDHIEEFEACTFSRWYLESLKRKCMQPCPGLAMYPPESTRDGCTGVDTNINPYY